MRYFLDTEFIEDGVTIDLISIGIVAENGRELYAENLDADLSKASDWVKANVIPSLWSKQIDKSTFNMWTRGGGVGGLLTKNGIAREVSMFCNPQSHGEPEFWADYASYDWIVFCQLFGTMMDLPKGFPMYINDLQQTINELENPKLPQQNKGVHNALEDARWNRKVWEFLRAMEATQ